MLPFGRRAVFINQGSLGRGINSSILRGTTGSGAGAAPFNRSTLNPIAGFYAASLTASLSSGSGAIIWRDDYPALSGAQDLSQSTEAGRPILNSAHPAFNNKPVLSFSGSSMYDAAPEIAYSGLYSGLGGTMWVVWRALSDRATPQQLIFQAGGLSSGNQGIRMQYQGSTQKILITVSNGTNIMFNMNETFLTGVLGVANLTVYRFLSGSVGDDFEVWNNGVRLHSGEPAAPGTGSAPSLRTIIGSTSDSNPGAGNFLHGDIAEIFVAPYLNNAQIAELTGALKQEYGIP